MRPGESYLPVQMLCFPGSSAGKEFTCDAADPSSIPGSRRSSEKGIGYPLQYSWASLVAQLVKNLPVMWRPGFDPWVGKIPWRREWLPTLVFLPEEFHGLHSPWGHKESDMTEPFSASTTGGLVVKTPSFHFRRQRFNPRWEN